MPGGETDISVRTSDSLLPIVGAFVGVVASGFGLVYWIGEVARAPAIPGVAACVIAAALFCLFAVLADRKCRFEVRRAVLDRGEIRLFGVFGCVRLPLERAGFSCESIRFRTCRVLRFWNLEHHGHRYVMYLEPTEACAADFVALVRARIDAASAGGAGPSA